MNRRWLIALAVVVFFLVVALVVSGALFGSIRCIGDDPSNAVAWACKNGDTPEEALKWAIVLIFPLAAAGLGVVGIKRSLASVIVGAGLVLGIGGFFANIFFWGYAGT